MNTPLIAFYGDDFTGSTDVLESLSLNGLKTLLFLEPPHADDLEEFEGIQAVGIAGRSRSMRPAEMDSHLPEMFEALGALDPTLVHYKVCSTFDSSPEIGSIGHAIDLAQSEFESPFVPVVVAAPSLEPRGRYVLFGNMFATVDDTTYRLDRHPTMREHPVTPMSEADLRRHLGEQTDRDIGLLDIRSIDQKEGPELVGDLNHVLESGAEIVFFDGLNIEHQRKVGKLVWEHATDETDPLFTASSSGLSYAITSHLTASGIIEVPEPPQSVESADQIIVMSGSASQVNQAQIDWALDNGFSGVRLDTEHLVDPETAVDARKEAVDNALSILENGDSVILYSARGPNDQSIHDTLDRVATLGIDESTMAKRLGGQQGMITRRLLDVTDLERVCIAGGDTSGYVVPKLDIFALEFVVPVGPGSPLCRARARNPQIDGLEIALKGGQVQTTANAADYFGAVRDGGRPT